MGRVLLLMFHPDVMVRARSEQGECPRELARDPQQRSGTAQDYSVRTPPPFFLTSTAGGGPSGYYGDPTE